MYRDLQRLSKHSVIYGIGSVLNKSLGFLMLPIYTRYLMPEDYGLLELLLLTSAVASTFLALGLSQATLRFYFEYDHPEQRMEVISTGLWVSLVSTLAGLACIAVFADDISRLTFGTAEYELLLWIILATTFFEVTMEVPMSYLRAREYSKLFTAANLFQLLIGLSMNLYWVVWRQQGVEGVLKSGLTSAAVTWLALLVYTTRQVGLRWSYLKARELLVYGAPLIFSGFGMFIMKISNRLFLNHYSSLTQVGLFSLGDKLSRALGFLILGPFWRSYGPFRFSIMKQPNAAQIYSRVLTYFLFVMIFLGTGLAMMAKEVLQIIAAPPFWGAANVVPLLVVAKIWYGLYYLTQTGIYLQKKTRVISVIITVTASVNLLLNWLLIQRYGVMGAAVASVGSFAFLAVVTHRVAQWLYPITYEVRRIVTMVAVAAGMYAAGIWIAPSSVWLALGLKAALLAGFPLLLGVAHFYTEEEKTRLRSLWLMGVERVSATLSNVFSYR
ncbi:MAG: oligosaccharide flippase family protein [Nitrospirota bacterium]